MSVSVADVQVVSGVWQTSCSPGLFTLLNLSRKFSSTTLHGFATPSVHGRLIRPELRTDEAGGRAQFKSACQKSKALRSEPMQEFAAKRKGARLGRQWTGGGREGELRCWLGLHSSLARPRPLRKAQPCTARALLLPSLTICCVCAACALRWAAAAALQLELTSVHVQALRSAALHRPRPRGPGGRNGGSGRATRCLAAHGLCDRLGAPRWLSRTLLAL